MVHGLIFITQISTQKCYSKQAILCGCDRYDDYFSKSENITNICSAVKVTLSHSVFHQEGFCASFLYITYITGFFT